MDNKISTKLGYVRTDGWRGYEQPIYAVGGANDTGGWEDSPCPSEVCHKELQGFKLKLKEAGINFKSKYCKTSNVFCIHRYVIVSEADHAKAYQIAKEYEHEDTHLFYACKILASVNQ